MAIASKKFDRAFDKLKLMKDTPRVQTMQILCFICSFYMLIQMVRALGKAGCLGVEFHLDI